jgi:glycosyltransferase involved in cell wall biosynthesis
MNSAASTAPAANAPRAQSAGEGSRGRSNLEVIIPAYNEELNLTHALKSVCDWADAVYIVDSGSTDGTRRIAESFGAKVVDRPWLGYAAQKNWALDNLPMQADWVFFLDADESITPELREEILAITKRPAEQVPTAGFYVNRLTYFLSKPLRHCGYFPSYNLRLFKRGKARYEQREVHEHMIVDGPTQRLKHIMLHEDRRGLEHFIAKHNRYSTLEAREFAMGREHQSWHDPAAGEAGIAYRRWLKKHILPRLPLSGLWRFIYMYFARLGFLDGATGLRFCLLLATYDVFISLKYAELRALQKTGPRSVAAPGGLAIPEGRLRPTLNHQPPAAGTNPG